MSINQKQAFFLIWQKLNFLLEIEQINHPKCSTTAILPIPITTNTFPISPIPSQRPIYSPPTNVFPIFTLDGQSVKENNQSSFQNINRSKQLGLNPNLNIEDEYV